jgi:hypothetical protein
MQLKKVFVGLGVVVLLLSGIFVFQRWQQFEIKRKNEALRVALVEIRESLSQKKIFVEKFCPIEIQAENEKEKKEFFRKTKSFVKSVPRRNGWPSTASINANNLIAGEDCSATQITSSSMAKIFERQLPSNPWGFNKGNMVYECLREACDRSLLLNCSGLPLDSESDGWCYNPTSGEIWGNSKESLNF